jgi:hypothetical protein
MKKLILVATMLFIVFISCNRTKNEQTKVKLKPVSAEKTTIINTQSEGYTLMKNNCYVCHNPKAESHDNIIAPPLVAVKRRYSMQYSSKEEFTNAMVNWVQNPIEKKALMRGAVTQFKVMQKMDLDTETLHKIGNYMYENTLEQPKWFQTHFNKMQGNGKK